MDGARHVNQVGRTRARFLAIVLLALLSTGPAWGFGETGKLADFRHAGWGPSEGAPNDTQSLVQTTDGFLWMAASGGLFRFDGVRFEHVDLPHDERVTSSQVSGLFAPSSGGLWVGFVFGGAAWMQGGRMQWYGEADGLPTGSITAFARDSTGVVWAAGLGTLMRLDGSRWQQMGAAENVVDPGRMTLMVDSADTLWTVSRSKVLYLPKGERVFREAVVRPVPPHGPNPGVPGLAESASGAVWLYRDQAIQMLHRNVDPEKRVATSGSGIVANRDGSLWLARVDGKIQRIADADALDAQSLTYAEDPSDSFSETEGLTFKGGYGQMLVDREGNVWMATLAGIDRFSERRVARVVPVLREAESFVPSRTAIVAGDDGSLWVGGPTMAVQRLDRHGAQRRDEIGPVFAALRGRDGALWFANSTHVSKYVMDHLESTSLPGNVPDPFGVQAMAQDGSGALWVSLIRRGVFRLEHGQWTEWGNLAALPRRVPLTLSTDTRGRLWFGYPAGGLAVLDGARLTVFASPNLPPVGAVTAILGTRGPLWVGGDSGLAWFDGTAFHAVATEARIALDSITGIVATADGDLWLSAGVGLVHIEAAEIARLVADATHRVRVEVFDAFDGVIGSGQRLRPLPTLVEGSDARLWLITNLGLYAVDPARIRRNAVPPPVVIKAIVADDKVHDAAAGLRLPPHTMSLRIDYAGLSLTAPEKVRYRYKLDGVDDGWQDARGRNEAFYTGLGPGAHRFHVVAANNDGVWNDEGATLDFVIAPTFVQTRWFIALCVLGAAALAATLVHFRFRQLAARMRDRFDARTAERERIARELHETLLQGAQGLILSVQGAAARIPADSPAREILERALDRADSVMIEGRARIKDLRISPDADIDLAESLAAIGEELAIGSSVSFRTLVTGNARVLVPSVRQEAYQIAREALLNAFRHADAKSIEVEVVYADDDFRVRVRDDGIGIDMAVPGAGVRPGHWGMQGMRERAARVGARLDAWSRPAAGVEIELRVLAASAYQDRAKAPGWSPGRVLARMRS